MKDKKLTYVVNCILAVLMLLYIILTFVPYIAYTATDGSTATSSIQNYIWMVPDGMNEYIQSSIGDNFYDINASILGPIVCTVCALIGAVICLIFSKKGASSILPLIVGILGVIDGLTNPLLTLGNLWIVYIVLTAVIAVLAAFNAVKFFNEYKEKKKNESI